MWSLLIFPWISLQPSILSYSLFSFVFSLWIFLNDSSLSFLSCVLLLYLEIKVTKRMWPRFSYFWKLWLAIFLRLSLLCQLTRTKSCLQLLQDYYINGYNIFSVIDLFYFLCSHVLLSSPQVCCCSIPSMRFELFGYLESCT